MTKNEIEKINTVFSAIIGQPLRDFARSGDMLFIDFGELVEVNAFKIADGGGLTRDENGNPIPIKRMRGEYGIDSMCSMRFTCGADVVFAKSDIFIPTEALAHSENYNGGDFDWHIQGNTLFDELLNRHFHGDFSEYIVKSVKVGRFGDLTITFENDFVLEFFADGSGYSENWRFGETKSTDSLIVTSMGIIDESH